MEDNKEIDWSEAQYWFLIFSIRSGEITFSEKKIMGLSTSEPVFVQGEIEDLMFEIMGGKNVDHQQDGQGYYYYPITGECLYIELLDMKELTKEEFEVLSKYL